jgi:hypothetical protein
MELIRMRIVFMGGIRASRLLVLVEEEKSLLCNTKAFGRRFK